MKFTIKPLFKNLSGILIFAWYTGLAVSAIAFIAIVIFLFSSFSNSNLNIPAISFRAGNFSYKFNAKYLEVINTSDIIRRYRQRQMGDLLSTDTWEKKCYESLFDFKFPPPPKFSGIKMDGNTPGYFLFDNNITWNFSGIFELRNVPIFPIAFSIMIISYLFFSLIILFNVRSILSVNSAENLFTMNSSKCIKYIGVFILISELIRLLLLYWINSSIVHKFYFSEIWGDKITTMIGNYYISWSDVNYWIIFVGLITLLISKVIKSGASLKEDVDLTI